MEKEQLLQSITQEISVCLSDIPREKMHKADNGKIYVNLTVAKRREPDQWKRDLKVYVSQLKEEREAGKVKVYVGAGRTIEFQPKKITPPSNNDLDELLGGAPPAIADF